MVKNWDTIEPSGNHAVDMVATCVFEHRKKNTPIKSIKLNHRAFTMFEDYVKKHKPDYISGAIIEFDGVEVYKDFLQGAYIKCEYYPMKLADA